MAPPAWIPPPRESLAPAAGAGDDRAGKYLIFRLGREEFGARVMQVREIMGLQEVTPVPHTPEFVKGVINLRGKVIPVVDLRLKFGLSPEPCTAHTCIIVVRMLRIEEEDGKEEESMMGIVVDEVVEVINLAASEIEDTPDFGTGVLTPWLLGVAKVREKVKILLDINRALHSKSLDNHELQGLSSLMQ